MPKRFTDTAEWDQRWFIEMSPESKNIWNYIKAKCESSGLMKLDASMIAMQTGYKEINLQKFLEEVNIDYDKETGKKHTRKRIIKVCGGKKLWLTGFIAFQYGNSENEVSETVAAVKGAINQLKKENLYDMAIEEGFIRVIKGYKGLERVIDPDIKGKGNGIGNGNIKGGKEEEKGGVGEKEETPEELKKAYKKDPKLLFVRFWRRNAGDEEVKFAKGYIEKYGIDITTYGFMEAMKHAAFSLSYVEAVCKKQQAKTLSIKIENQSAAEKEIEKQELKNLEKKVKDEESRYHQELWDRYRKIKENKTISEREKNKILQLLQKNEYISAEVAILDIEQPNQNKSSPKNGRNSFNTALNLIAQNDGMAI